MRAGLLVTALLLPLALFAAGCGGSSDQGESPSVAGAPIKTIDVSETEFSLDPATIQLDEPGIYAFRAVNSGSTTHALEIEGDGVEAETEQISPGGESTLKVKLSKAGTYELYCPVGNHRDQGMVGKVVVGGAAASGGAGTVDTDDDATSDQGKGDRPGDY